jgi:hypothetical protein
MRNFFQFILILIKRLSGGFFLRLSVGISLFVFSIYKYIYLFYQSFSFDKNRNNYIVNFLKSFFGDDLFLNNNINFSFFFNIFKPRLFFKSLLDLKHIKSRSELFLTLSKVENKRHISRLVKFITKGNVFLIKSSSFHLGKHQKIFKGYFFNPIDKNFFFENNFIQKSSSLNFSYKSLVRKRILVEFSKIFPLEKSFDNIFNFSFFDLATFSKLILHISKSYPFFLVLNIIYIEIFKFKLYSNFTNFIFFDKYKSLFLKIFEYIFNYSYLRKLIKLSFLTIYIPYILLLFFVSIFLSFILFFTILWRFFKLKGFFFNKILYRVFSLIFNKNVLINEEEVFFFKEFVGESFLLFSLIFTLRSFFQTKILHFFSKNIFNIDEEIDNENLGAKKFERILFSEESFKLNFMQEKSNSVLNIFYFFIILVYIFFWLFLILKLISLFLFFNLWFLFFSFFVLIYLYIYIDLFLIEFNLLKFFIFGDFLNFFKLKFILFYFKEKNFFIKYLLLILVKISFFFGKSFLNLNFFFDKKLNNSYLYFWKIIDFSYLKYIFFIIKQNFFIKLYSNYFVNKILILLSFFFNNFLISFFRVFFKITTLYRVFSNMKNRFLFIIKICFLLFIIFSYKIFHVILMKLKNFIYLVFIYFFVLIMFIYFKIKFIFYIINIKNFLYKKTKGFSNILGIIYTIIFDKETSKHYLFVNNNKNLIKNDLYILKIYNYFLKIREEGLNYIFRKFSNEKYFQFILNQENIRNKLDLKKLNKAYLTYIIEEKKLSNLFKKSRKHFNKFNVDIEFLKLRIEKNIITENEVNFVIKNKIENLITLLKENKIIEIKKGDIVYIKKEKKIKNLLFRLKARKKHIKKKYVSCFTLYKERKLFRKEINKLFSENKEIANIVESYKSKKDIPFLILQTKFKDIYLRNYIFKRFVIYQKLQTLNGSRHIWLKKWLKNYQINLQIQKLLFENQNFGFCYRNNIPRTENLKLEYHFMNLIYIKYLFSMRKFFTKVYFIIVLIFFILLFNFLFEFKIIFSLFFSIFLSILILLDIENFVKYQLNKKLRKKIIGNYLILFRPYDLSKIKLFDFIKICFKPKIFKTKIERLVTLSILSQIKHELFCKKLYIKVNSKSEYYFNLLKISIFFFFFIKYYIIYFMFIVNLSLFFNLIFPFNLIFIFLCNFFIFIYIYIIYLFIFIKTIFNKIVSDVFNFIITPFRNMLFSEVNISLDDFNEANNFFNINKNYIKINKLNLLNELKDSSIIYKFDNNFLSNYSKIFKNDRIRN